MATLFLLSISNAKLYLHSSSWSQQQIVCTTHTHPHPSSAIAATTTRRSTALSLSASAATLFLSSAAGAAILEADEDDELMEKVKRDRKKRLEKQSVISSSTKERAYLQELVYKLSKIGESIENNNLSQANSVLGSGKDIEWLQKVKSALNKLSSSEEEKTEVDIFNLSLTSLISSISKNDVEASKVAFVASASAFEKWTTLSGLAEQLKGL